MKGITGTIKIKNVYMNIQNLKTVFNKDLNIQAIFRLNNTYHSTEIFNLLPNP